MTDDYETVENYGDVHLHYDGYPEYKGFKSGQCKWNGNNYKIGSPHIPDEPLYPQRCPTEYCHPGTWQGTGAAPMPVMIAAPEPSLMDQLNWYINMIWANPMYKIIASVIIMFLVYYIKTRYFK